MRETLFVRLGSHPSHQVMWMVWSEQEQEVIASGVLPHADELATLEDRVAGRRLIALVPGSDVTVHRVSLPAKAQKQALKALPFLVEEHIAEEIDHIHLTLLAQEGQSADIMAVKHSQMAQWTDALKQAGLTPTRMLPDWLALPYHNEQVHAVQLGEQWLFRTQPAHGFALDDAEIDHWLPLVMGELEANTVVAHTPLHIEGGNVEQQLDELPLMALTEGALTATANLLHSGYAIKRKRQHKFRVWYNVAIVAAVALVLYFVNGVVELNQLQAQKQQVQAEIVATYQHAFPREKNVKATRIRAILKQKLAAVGGGQAQQQSMLVAFEHMLPAFTQISSLDISSLHYRHDKHEIRLQAMAASFDDYEKLKTLLDKHFTVELGALNTVQNKVRGEIVLRSKG